jgi:hypothetical protein
MVCAIQWVQRKECGGYLVNDGTHTVFVDTHTQDNTTPLYIYLGIGDTHKGKSVYESALIMPSMVINAAQYNALVSSMPNDSQEVFKG